MKNSKKLTGLSNNSGQALIEYVLILIITISLLLALIAQVFTPFQTFISQYMGTYVQCLLETGELPSFGYADSSLGDESCAAKFGAASWNKGKGGGSSSAGNDNKSNGSKTNPSSTSSSESSSSGSSGRRSTYAGSQSRNGSMFVNRRGGARGGIGDSSQNSKVVEIALENGGSGGFFKGSDSNSYRPRESKTRAVGLAGLSDEEKKKLAKKIEGNGKVTVVSDGRIPASKKTAVKKPEVQAAAVAEDEGMTIGNFIRYLFIAALIIALVLFIGGQALQMSKSFEK